MKLLCADHITIESRWVTIQWACTHNFDLAEGSIKDKAPKVLVNFKNAQWVTRVFHPGKAYLEAFLDAEDIENHYFYCRYNNYG